MCLWVGTHSVQMCVRHSCFGPCFDRPSNSCGGEIVVMCIPAGASAVRQCSVGYRFVVRVLCSRGCWKPVAAAVAFVQLQFPFLTFRRRSLLRPLAAPCLFQMERCAPQAVKTDFISRGLLYVLLFSFFSTMVGKDCWLQADDENPPPSSNPCIQSRSCW